MLTIPDLNRLKVFHVIYEHRSLIGAAQALGITRSAVSQSLKALEAEFKLKLFLRDSKKVLPTEAAKKLFLAMEPLISGLQLVVNELENSQQEPAGLLKVGAPQDFGSGRLTDAIVGFHKKHPEVNFEVTLAVPVKLLGLLSEGKLDIAFIDNADVHAKDFPVSVVTVMKENFVLVCSKKYFELKVKQTAPKLSDLKNLQFVDYLPHAPVTKIWIRHTFKKSAADIQLSYSAESVRAVIAAIKGGLGIGVVPEHLVKEELKSGSLKALYPSEPVLVNQIALARRLERSPTFRETLFVEHFKTYSATTASP